MLRSLSGSSQTHHLSALVFVTSCVLRDKKMHMVVSMFKHVLRNLFLLDGQKIAKLTDYEVANKGLLRAWYACTHVTLNVQMPNTSECIVAHACVSNSG